MSPLVKIKANHRFKLLKSFLVSVFHIHVILLIFFQKFPLYKQNNELKKQQSWPDQDKAVNEHERMDGEK